MSNPPPPPRLRKSKYYTNLERLNECIEQYSDTNTSSEQLNQPSCSKQLQESDIHNLQTNIHLIIIMIIIIIIVIFNSNATAAQVYTVVGDCINMMEDDFLFKFKAFFELQVNK